MLEYDEYGNATGQEIQKIPRIPLAKRLERKKKKKPNFLNVFEISTFDYFSALSEISMDLHFVVKRYENFVFEKGGRRPHLMATCVHHIDSLSSKDRERMMYYIFIEPFVRIPSIPKDERKLKG